MAQLSDCSKSQKAKVAKTFSDMAVKFGKAAANAAIGVYNSTLDALKSILNAEKTVLTPLATLDQVFLDSFVRFPYNTISSTVTSATASIIAPLNQVGMLGGTCSDTRLIAKSATSSIDSLNKDLDNTKRMLDKLSLYNGASVLKGIDQSIGTIDLLKIPLIP